MEEGIVTIIKNKMSKYIIPEKMLEEYRHFVNAVINAKSTKNKISMTNSFTAEGRTITFILEAYKDE